MDNSETKERNTYIDIVKFILSFLIIGIHVRVFQENDFIFAISTHIQECAMPLFSIVTGYYFTINYEKAGSNYTKQFISHILIVYLIWSTIEYLLCMVREQYRAGYVYLNIRAWLLDDFTYGRFWYFGAMIVFALLVEIEICCKRKWNAKIIDKAATTLIIVLCILMELTCGYSKMLNPNVINGFFHKNYITLLIRRMILYALPFLYFGHYISQHRNKLEKIKQHTPKLLLAGLTLYVIECAVVEIVMPPVKTMVPYILTIFFFLVLLNVPFKQLVSTKFCNYLRCLSGFIYCFHTIAIYYYRTTLLQEKLGGGSRTEYIFVAVTSWLTGTILYWIFGKRMRKFIA